MKSLILTIIILVVTLSAFAQNVDPIGKDKVANGGYDLVSYFTDNAAAKGKAEYTEEHNGVKYRFASAEHKTMFKSNPDKYLPVCDGYCAWGVAEKGARVPVNPTTYKIINGKLHLFFNGDFSGKPLNTLAEWNKDEKHLLEALPAKWAQLNK